MSELYGPEYFEQYGYGVDQRRAEAYEIERDEVLKRAHGFGKVFDYGCGTGDFLETFPLTWSKNGWDISPFARSVAWNKGLLMVRPGDAKRESYDMVVFRGTIQHIHSPVKALIQAYTLLKPGGLLAILATPNTESVVYRTWGTLPALDPPRNWFIPGARELRNVLVNVGFTDIETRFPYLSSPYADPIKDLLSFCASKLFGYRKFAWPGNMMEMYGYK